MKIVFSDLERVIIQGAISGGLRFIELQEGKRFTRKMLQPYRRLYKKFNDHTGRVSLQPIERSQILSLVKLSHSITKATLAEENKDKIQEFKRNELLKQYEDSHRQAFESAIEKLETDALVVPPGVEQ